MSRETTNSLHPALAVLAIGAAACVGVRAAVRASRRINFKGKSVLITGSSRGLGLVLARQFAAEGARVAITARNASQLDAARDDLLRRGAEVLAVPCDVTSEQKVGNLIEAVNRRFGGIDVLVNNAGTIEVGPLETMTVADFETAMRTHFWGPLFTSLAVLPQMRSRRAGRIVNISSIGGKIAIPHLLPYSASKFALVGFSEGLRAELVRDNIYVTTICPGLMRTGSARNALFKGRHREEFAWFVTGDSLPVTSMSAVRAANQILDACRYGRAEAVLSIQAKMAVTFHDLFPSLTADISGWINRLLPDAGGIGEQHELGKNSETAYTRSFVTELDRRARAANNEAT